MKLWKTTCFQVKMITPIVRYQLHMKKYGITYKFLADIVKKHKHDYIRLMFHRKKLSIGNAAHVRKYIEKHL